MQSAPAPSSPLPPPPAGVGCPLLGLLSPREGQVGRAERRRGSLLWPLHLLKACLLALGGSVLSGGEVGSSEVGPTGRPAPSGARASRFQDRRLHPPPLAIQVILTHMCLTPRGATATMMSVTHRFRNKFVTVVIYKPRLAPSSGGS